MDWPGPLVIEPPRTRKTSPGSLDEIRTLVADGLEKEHFRDLNNANNQAPGATHMMVSHIGDLDHAVSLLGSNSPASAADLLELLTAPYPFARYLALRELGRDPFDHEELLLAHSIGRQRRPIRSVSIGPAKPWATGGSMRPSPPWLAMQRPRR